MFFPGKSRTNLTNPWLRASMTHIIEIQQPPASPNPEAASTAEWPPPSPYFLPNMATLRSPRRSSREMPAAIFVLLLLVVSALADADVAIAATATSGGSTGTKQGNGGSTYAKQVKGKLPSLTGVKCVEMTGVPGCMACSAPSGAHQSKSNTRFRYRCTVCAGEEYLAEPVSGICLCQGGYGRGVLAGMAVPANGGAKSKSKSSHGRGGSTPSLPLAACVACPPDSVSPAGVGVCSPCAQGYEPFLPQRVSCSPVCTPLTCADVGATCGTISDGCSSTVECGECSGSLTCDPVTNQCGCTEGAVGTVSNSCVSLVRFGCAQGGDCRSGVCDDGVCVEGCPPLSEPAGSSAADCVCSSGSYSKDGKAPCVACSGGSVQPEKGKTVCECESPRVWDPASNTCACPVDYVWINNACLPTGGPTTSTITCTSNSDCSSALCPSPGTAGCSTRSCADGSAPLGTTGCLCPPGTFSSTGERPVSGGCTPCPTGSVSATTYGSTSCVCNQPTSSIWDLTTNACVCVAPNTATADNKACLLRNSETCLRGTDCASGICSRGLCAAKCGTNASTDAVGNCACAVNTWGPGGLEPCRACLEGATTNGATGQSSCNCAKGQGKWSPATGGCECKAGQEHSKSTGLCRTGNLRACTTGTQCASGVCSGIVCVDQCPIGSQADSAGLCRCLPNSFGPGGAPANSVGCTPCGGGSYAPLAGSSACSCSQPSGATWVQQTNSCACPVGQQPSADGKTCVTSNGGTCATGSTCASGVCGPQGTCITQSQCTDAAGVVSDGVCKCAEGLYGAGGVPPCYECGGGSGSLGVGNTVCSCDASKGLSWSKVGAFFQCCGSR